MKRIALVAVLALVGVALFTPWLFGRARGPPPAPRHLRSYGKSCLRGPALRGEQDWTWGHGLCGNQALPDDHRDALFTMSNKEKRLEALIFTLAATSTVKSSLVFGLSGAAGSPSLRAAEWGIATWV